MLNAQITKSGIEPLPILTYKVGTGDITTYLRNQLGFNIGVDYCRWTGITAISVCLSRIKISLTVR